jgi:ATP-dependent exoDNAse (exonuclease V) beta subunit
LVGTDLGPQLVRALKKLSENMQLPQEDVLNAINIWEQQKLRKARDSGVVADKAECLRVFASFGPTLGAAIAYCEHLFAAKGPIQLLSGHKAKGLEWPVVYHLDPHRIPSPWSKEGEALEQERNVKYVIETRAKEALYFVRLDEFVGGDL